MMFATQRTPSIVTLLYLVLCAGGAVGAADGRSRRPDPKQVSRIVKVLDDTPVPTRLKKDDLAERQRVVTMLTAVGEYPTPAIRSAVKQFLDRRRPDDLDEQSKVFLLNRCIFAVPEREPRDPPWFHSWAIESSDLDNFMRPLALDAEGRIVFEGSFLFYIGPPYLALREFDSFESRFGRRRVKAPGEAAAHRSGAAEK
jgi:hypothetical protein